MNRERVRKRIAIDGAASNMGHHFLTYYANDPDNVVHAIDKSWVRSDFNVPSYPARVIRHEVDPFNPASLENLSRNLEGQPIDLFILASSAEIPHAEGVPYEPSASDVGAPNKTDIDSLLHSLMNNVLAAFCLIRTILPNLKASRRHCKCIVIGSGCGSIAEASGGSYAYGSSQAGLNFVMKSLSIDVPGVTFAIVDPGKIWATYPHEREFCIMEAQQAVATMLPTIEGLPRSSTASFMDRDGKRIPW